MSVSNEQRERRGEKWRNIRRGELSRWRERRREEDEEDGCVEGEQSGEMTLRSLEVAMLMSPSLAPLLIAIVLPPHHPRLPGPMNLPDTLSTPWCLYLSFI